MTVRQLIKQLQKMPQHLQVYGADHDHGEYETAHPVDMVNLVNQENASEREREDVCFNCQPKKYVVLRP